MPFFVLAFLSGDLFLQLFSSLPSQIMLVLLTTINFLIYFSLKNRIRLVYLLFAFVLGFAWSAWYAQGILSWSLPKSWEGRPVTITGYVASLPVRNKWQTYFFFALQTMQVGGDLQPGKALVRLAWRDHQQPIKAGEKRQFLVRLKRIHGTQNPGTFDYEAWSLQKGLRASGYILTSPLNKVISHHWYHYPIAQFRQNLQEKIRAHLPQSRTAPWLMALIMGEREGIAQEDWQVLRQTGTNHLMAIAGLHIGIMAGFTHMLIAWSWRRFERLTLWLPAQQAGACAALIVAVLYSALAGFSVPTQRACLMLAAFIFSLLSRRKLNAWYGWSLALLLVLMLNPLCVLTESFWLSFGTLALIIYGMGGRLAPRGLWWKWGRVQWVVGLGLTPITLVLFQQCSLVSFLANSIAIPWLGCLILPFCFLSGICLLILPSVGGLCLLIADKSLAVLWTLLAWFSALPFSAWYHAMPDPILFFITMTGFLLLLLPAGFPGKWAGILWVLPLLLYKPAAPAEGDVWLTLLDVGQGLSVVVQTKTHLLVYDAGPRYAGMDMGESVVLPFLHKIGARQIDLLVISHGDNDHIGGAGALVKALSVGMIKTSVPEKWLQPIARTCFAGDTWQWDKVLFTFIYPDKNQLSLGNDSSCVLRITAHGQSILLTGDIEKYAEENLLEQASHHLQSTILVAPHHGSKTSGLAKFIVAVRPQFVLYATGYRNRYHFPHPQIVSFYEAIQARQLNTAETGAIQFRLKEKNAVLSPEIYRKTHHHYWHAALMEDGIKAD
ncbi:DNA internalization-related competence protein ComEC/Rec2 [Aquicella lusitana]|nr:DNA internalization-related competence protein ComEC/Rec2 [Aquicella lusitana]